MSLDLSSALRDVAEHAPVGALEPGGLGRRIRRRRAARTATRSAVGVGLAGAIAVAATHVPGPLIGVAPADSAAPTPTPAPGLPQDQVATVLPAADPAAAPGECGWTVQPPSEDAFGWNLGVSLGPYPAQTYGPVAATVTAWPVGDVVPPDPVRLVAARDGVVVAAAEPAVFEEFSMGSAGVDLEPLACGGPDELKVLPDGTYRVYALVTDVATGEVRALSPSEELVMAGNARQAWCHADESVLGTGDGRVVVTGGLQSSGGELAADVAVVWAGSATAQVLAERLVLVDDATGLVALDSSAPGMEGSASYTHLVPGEGGSTLPLMSDRTSCDGGPLPSGTYRAYVVVTIGTSGADRGPGRPTNAAGVAQLRRGVTVP